MKNTIKAVVAAVAVCGASSAEAVLHTYVLGGDSSVSANTGAGLIISSELAPTLAGTSFSLDDGNSWTFDFFKIWTDETFVDQDDKNAVQVTATLDFSTPNFGANVDGLTYAVTVFNGVGQYGEVAWQGPSPTFTLGDRVFRVSLNNARFNEGRNIGGLASGEDFGAMIRATVTQLSSSVPPPPVPDHGNTALLLGLALAGVVVFRRKQVATL